MSEHCNSLILKCRSFSIHNKILFLKKGVIAKFWMELKPHFQDYATWSQFLQQKLVLLCVFPFAFPSLRSRFWGLEAGSTYITQLPWHLLGLFHIRRVWQRGEFCFPFIMTLFVDNLKGWKKETFIWAFQLCSQHINERSSAHRNPLICVLPGNNCKSHWNLQGELKSPVEEFYVSKYQQIPAPPIPDFSYLCFRGRPTRANWTWRPPWEFLHLGRYSRSSYWLKLFRSFLIQPQIASGFIL